MVAPSQGGGREVLCIEMIGVFDSGYGGLTIFRELLKRFPEYSFMYLGDNAHAPYGNKSEEEIIEYTKRGVDELFKRGCVLVILGCNTASAVALRYLQQEWLTTTWPDRRLLGIVVPTIEQITSGKDSLRVGVLGTKRTVESGAYEHEIQKRNPNIRVTQAACNNLAGLIEDLGSTNTEVVQEAQACVQELLRKGDVDDVLLGCTHYELVASVIANALPEGTKLFHQPSIVAKSLEEYLKRHPEIDSRIKKTGKRIFITTGDGGMVTRHSENYIGKHVVFEGVK